MTGWTLPSIRLNAGHANRSEWTRDATHKDTGNHKEGKSFFNPLGLNTHTLVPWCHVSLVGWRRRRPGVTSVTLCHKGHHDRVTDFQLCDSLRHSKKTCVTMRPGVGGESCTCVGEREETKWALCSVPTCPSPWSRW